MHRSFIILYIFLCLPFCTNTQDGNKKNIDAFIANYNSQDFSVFRGISIVQRSASITEVVYEVNKLESNLPVYFVSYDRGSEKITRINNPGLKRKNTADYLSADEIEKYIKAFRNYKFFLLAVDNDNNLYVNPFHENAPPYLLRLNKSITDSIVRKGFVYEHYKGSWFVNRTKR